METDFSEYLEPSLFVDSDHPEVARFARQNCMTGQSHREKAVSLYLAIRDGFRYNPNILNFHPDRLKASYLLGKSQGMCVEKANLLAACCRSLGIPASLGFATVTNHIASSKLERYLRTKKLVFHGYTEIFLEGQWVKATPAFNAELCQALGVAPLEFDGLSDSIFQPFSPDGKQFMAYLHDYGHYADIPYDFMLEELERHYPDIFAPPYFDPVEQVLNVEAF